MTSDGLPHQVRAVISNAREDSTAVTWYELTRRREQRLAYVRAYGAYWQKGSGGGRAAALEALESKMSLELCMRYRELTRVVGASLPGRWWEAPSWARAGAEEASSWALLLPPLTVASGAGAGAPPPEKKGGFDWFGLFKPIEDEEGADGGGARGAGAAQGTLSSAAASSVASSGATGGGSARYNLGDGGDSAALDDALRRQVRARYSLGERAELPETALQKLLDEIIEGESLAVADLDGKPLAAFADYVQTEVAASLGALSATLLASSTSVLAVAEIVSPKVSLKQRTYRKGLGLQARVGALRLIDRLTPCAPLACALTGERRGGQDWLVLSLDTEPLHSDAAMHLQVAMQPLITSLITCAPACNRRMQVLTPAPSSPQVAMQPLHATLNPRLLAACGAWFQVPPSQWSAAIELEKVTRGLLVNLVGAIREIAMRTWRNRPVHLGVFISTLTVFWVQPPPLRADASPSSLTKLTRPTRPTKPRSDALALHGLELHCEGILLSSEEAVRSDADTVPKRWNDDADAGLVGGAAPVHSEQAFGLSLSGLRLSLLPAAQCVAWLADPVGAVACATPLTHPLNAQLTLAVLLQPMGVEVPWVRAQLAIDPVRLRVHEGSLAALTTLAVGSGQALDPAGEGGMMLPGSEDETPNARADERGLGAVGETPTTAPLGWFSIQRSQEVQGRVDAQLLGDCHVSLELGYLVYEMQQREGESSIAKIKLKDYEVRGGPTPESFQLCSTFQALGVFSCETYTLVAESRSLSTRFQSACAAMQALSRAEAPVVKKKKKKPRAADALGFMAAERQNRLVLDARIGGLFVELLPDSVGGGAARSSSAALVSCALRELRAHLVLRKRDVRCAVQLESADLQIAVREPQLVSTPAHRPPTSILVPLIYIVPSAAAVAAQRRGDAGMEGVLMSSDVLRCPLISFDAADVL